MIIKLLSIILLVQTARSKPQFLTFENGKIGVNFGGYHAEAGLGGLLTGNAAHGGLSASAGTPYGQYAGAGLGGSLDGRTAGGLYAEASAGNGVGASAGLAGGLDANGMSVGQIGAESHTGSVSNQVFKATGTQPESVKTVTYVDEKPPSVDATYNKGYSATSTLNAQSSTSGGSVDSQSAVQTNVETSVPQKHHVQRVNKRHHHHRLWPAVNKVLTVGRSIHQVPRYVANTLSQAHANVVTGLSHLPRLDFRRFFDFTFFSNNRINGYLPSQQQYGYLPTTQQPAYLPTTQQPAYLPTTQQPAYLPTTQQPAYLPTTEQPAYLPTTQQPAYLPTTQQPAYLPTTQQPEYLLPQQQYGYLPAQPAGEAQTTQPQGAVQPESNVNGNLVAPSVQTQGSYAGSSSNTNVGYSGGVNYHGGSNLINDIFNIPIATLRAVNQLVSNRVAAVASGGNIDIHKTVTVNRV